MIVNMRQHVGGDMVQTHHHPQSQAASRCKGHDRLRCQFFCGDCMARALVSRVPLEHLLSVHAMDNEIMYGRVPVLPDAL